MDILSMRNKTLFAIGLSLAAVGCSDNDSRLVTEPAPPTPPPVVEYVYEVQVTNLTNAQPMSPVAIIAHSSDYTLFNIGQPVTVGLEQVAESGDVSDLLDEATSAGAFATSSGMGILAPAASETISFMITEEQAPTAYVSLATMLVNTNDAITAAKSVALAELNVGESKNFTTLSYDTGTEANTEAAGTIPGPADGGQGFDATRDDIADQITLHAGIITFDDGLTSSVLGHQHRWDNPVLNVTITRTQ